MTEFIQIDVNIDYPVGECITKNIQEIDKMAAALVKRYPGKPMTFWVTGSSGAIIAAIVCAKIKKPTKVIYVKKPGEDNHHTDEHPEPLKDSVKVILDDFTRSFDTIKRIISGMTMSQAKPDCLCLGGSLHGAHMGVYANMFPVIIANRIYIPDFNSIEESGEVDIAEVVRKWEKDKKERLF